jgi:probable HAF family extracellular repeat protein
VRTGMFRAMIGLVAFAAALVSAASGPAAAGPSPTLSYRVLELGSLGGTVSRSDSINDRGLVAGWSNLLGDTERHATLWDGTRAVDLGTLGGENSSIVWPVKNVQGRLAGISQTSTTDPLHEQWSCAAFIPATGQECRGFVWEGTRMWPLPTLGGNNGFAAGMNDLGLITGWAETPVHDPTCQGNDQVLQFLPVIYGPGRKQIRALPLLPGDSSGAAAAMNDRGQAVGISGLCDQAVGRLTARHAVLWSNGTVTDLGDLGAGWWNTPMAINDNGDVVGFAGDPGDIEGNVTHAFIWTSEHGMQRLIPGEDNSVAYGINDLGQVVGTECTLDNSSCFGFVWQNGQLTRINDAAPGFPGTITVATDINDDGVITGRATEATGRVAIEAIPVT